MRWLLALALHPVQLAAPVSPAPGGTGYVAFRDGPGRFPVVAAHRAAPIVVSAADHAGVIRVADDVQSDIGKATGSNDATMNPQWARDTSDDINVTTTVHQVDRPGRHTLTFWMVDPTIVVQRLVVRTAPLPYGYLGPPESRTGNAA